MIDASLEQLTVKLQAAFNAKDAGRIASLYTEGATLMPPNQVAVRGRAAIEAWYQSALGHIGTLQMRPARSSSLGDEAFQVGGFTTIARSGGQKSFKYALILKRVGSQWQIDQDIWNSDQPADSAESPA